MYNISYANHIWSVFEDHEGKITSSISLVDAIKTATDSEPMNTEFHVKFTRSGASQLRKLNP